MSKTDIEYLTDTWNPIAMRCDPVSPGCAHCWHLRMCARHAGNDRLPKELREARAGGPFCLMEKELTKPLRWRKPRTVGVQFMGDLFHPKVTHSQQCRVMSMIEACPRHTFLLLTKRIEGADGFFCCEEYGVPENAWLGVTVCNQQEADEKIPVLLQIPAAVRFLSLEPLLGDMLIKWWLDGQHESGNRPDWVIVGPETGPGARPCKLEWIDAIVSQCCEAGVPVFVKAIRVRNEIVTNINTISNMLGRPPESLRQMPERSGK